MKDPERELDPISDAAEKEPGVTEVSDGHAARPVGASLLESVGSRIGVPLKLLLRDESQRGDAAPFLKSSAEARALAPEGRGHYQLMGELARGGMGVVLRGHDVDLGRDVAMKVLLEERAGDPAMLQRFVEEAQITGQLQHPGIVPVYELGLMADARPFFTMKLVKGRTLGDLLTERASPETDRQKLIAIFEAVCQTMAYAHNRGVIHRDLKPSNVMVGAFGEVQVVDWGLAKVLRGSGATPEPAAARTSVIETVRSSTGSTASDSLAGAVMGTLSYMSPEQAKGEVAALDERTDVFALGGILCQILTGAPPYSGDKLTVLERARAADLDDAWVRLDACQADAELVSLARECLTPEKAARPRNAGVLARRVTGYVASVAERARAAQIEAAEARVKVGEERRRRRLTLGLAASVLVTVLGTGALWIWRQSERNEQRLRIEAEVAAAIGEAREKRGAEEWDAAIASLEKARYALQAGERIADLESRIGVEEGSLRAEIARWEAERALAEQRARFREQVEEIRTMAVSRTAARKVDAYADVFREHGIDLAKPDGELLQVVRERGMQEEVAEALVDWARLVREVEGGSTAEVRRLLQLALIIDTDELRSSMRRAILVGDRQAIVDIARAVDFEHLDPMTAIVLGDALWSVGQEAECIRVLAGAERRHPGDYHLQVKLAVRHINQVRTDLAYPHLVASRALQPENPWPLTWLAVARREAGDVGPAIELFERALGIDPDYAVAHHHLGVTYLMQQRLDPAIEHLRRALEREPEYNEVRRRLAPALYEKGEVREAIEHYRKAVECEPENPGALNSLAWVLATTSDLDARSPHEAVAFAERAVALERDAMHLNTLGVALYRAGKLEAAAAIMKEGIELGGDGPIDYFVLAMAEQGLGNADEARKWFETGNRAMSTADRLDTAEDGAPAFRDEAAGVLGL